MNCQFCGGLKMEPDKPYGLTGQVCYCNSKLSQSYPAVEIAKNWVINTPENVPNYIPVVLTQTEMRTLCDAILEAENAANKYAANAGLDRAAECQIHCETLQKENAELKIQWEAQEKLVMDLKKIANHNHQCNLETQSRLDKAVKKLEIASGYLCDCNAKVKAPEKYMAKEICEALAEIKGEKSY